MKSRPGCKHGPTVARGALRRFRAPRWSRGLHQFRAASVWLALLACGCCGCAGQALRSQSPEQSGDGVESPVRLVGDVAKPFGNSFIKVESVGLITGLAGTGEDPAPSPQRAAILHAMQTLGVREPNKLLASPNTALVVVRALLPPGVQKGDKVDVELRVPSRSETTSLRGGWLMEARLREMAVLGNQVHDGHLWAVAEGPVLVEPGDKSGQGRGTLLRGRVLGGAVALRSRNMGLVLSSDEKSVRLSSQVGAALNRRFHTFQHGNQSGVATPKTEEYIDLAVHPRYKDNIGRYLRVVGAVPIKETPAEQAARLGLLESQLLDPLTSATAALRLEAIGKPALPTLQRGLESSDQEVRFYSAEALAYLDQTAACQTLGDVARDEPAFRAYALAALSAMDDPAAVDRLRALFDATSAEARYGAFRALSATNPSDAVVRGENLGGQFSFHVLATAGPPMVHVSRTRRPEIVLFGVDQQLQTPLALDAGTSIMVTGAEGQRVTVSRFAANEPDQKRTVSTRLEEVIRAVVELGGTYPDVVEMLQHAKTTRVLRSRFEVDALPTGGRSYERHKADDPAEPTDADDARHGPEAANPLPELFSLRRASGS